jgi:hypothetical protein
MRPALLLRVSGKPAQAQAAVDAAAQAKPEPPRCRARRGGTRCEREAGHAGPHSSEWGDF